MAEEAGSDKMIEKRFTNIAKEPIFIVIQDNLKDEVLADDEVVELLNRLHEENKDLEYLCHVYVDFMVSEGYELADVIDYTNKVKND